MDIGGQATSTQYANLFSLSDPAAGSNSSKSSNGSTSEPPQQATAPADFDAFMAAWGTSNAEFDLDGSGTVDGADLGLFLSQVEAEDDEESEALTENLEQISSHVVQPEIGNAIDAVRQKYAGAQYSASEALTRANTIMKSIQGAPLGINQVAQSAMVSPSQDSSGINAYELLARLRGNEGLIM